MTPRWLPICYFLLLFFVGEAAFSQSITGTITDSQTNEPLPFVNVFISNTTKGTQTDLKGTFTLKLQSSGYSKVVASMVGYKPFEQELVLRPGETRRLTIRLQTDTKFLNEVKVSGKRDKQWKRLYKDFEREFLGRTKNARNSKILDPYQIDLKRKRQVLTATCEHTIEIENKALGYGIAYQLESFQTTSTAYEFSGKSLFKLLPATDENETRTWENNRNQTYRGSLRHFLRAVVNKKSRQEGFRVFLEADSTPTISRNRYFRQNSLVEINPDTLAYFDSALQRVVLPSHRYEIHYLNRRDPQSWYFDLDREISWLEIRGQSFAFSYNGILENSRQVETIGNMSKRRMADLLPDDYEPSDTLSNTQFENTGLIPNFQKQEKILLSLAQDHYISGDTVKYNIKVLDATSLRPSEQTIVYLTIRTQNNLIEQQKLWVASGEYQGYWVIPDSLKTGTYQLIVHNNWARNFDERFWARKNIQVVGNTLPTNQEQKTDSLNVSFFPESGNLVAGLSNRVGVTIFGQAGNPVEIKGWVVSAKADTLATFQSNTQGYGIFYITPPAEMPLKVLFSNGSTQNFLPAITKGYLMQTELLKDTSVVTIKIINNLLPTEWKPMRLFVHLRGQVLFEAIVTPKRNLTIAQIPREDLEGEGVMQILLLDALNHTIASRAFYQPAPISDEEEQKTFNLDLFAAELDTFSPFLIEIKKDTSNLLKNTDLLLLTHAVRPYSLASAANFEYESGISITGKIAQANRKVLANTPIIGFVNVDSTQLNFQAVSDEKGHFSSPPLFFFGKTDVVIQVQNDKIKNAVIAIDTLPSYVPNWRWIPNTTTNDSLKKDLYQRLSLQKSRTITPAQPLVRDFRRNYPKADTTLIVEERTMKGFTFLRILEDASKYLTIKTDGTYLKNLTDAKATETKMDFFVDSLPTTWESLKSLYGFEMEAVDIIQNRVNVLLKPNSSFFAEQNLKRFIVTGLAK